MNKQIGELGNGEEGITTTKTTKSNRKVFAPQFVIDTLKQYKASLPYIPLEKHIFFNVTTGKHISKHYISKRFKTLLIDSGLPPIRFHDLRHLQATLLMYSGVNPQSISQRLGHSNTNTTLQVYTHNISELDKQVVNQLETTIQKIKG